jgi:hypothetical protein
MAPFDTVLGLPVGLQFVPKPGVVRGVFVGEDGTADTQAVGEGVEVNGGFALGSLRTRRILGILLSN